MIGRILLIALAVVTAGVGGVVLASVQSSSGDESTSALPVLRSEPAEPTASTQPGGEANVTTTAEPLPDRTAELVASLTVEEKVGQLFMPVVGGLDATNVGDATRSYNVDTFGYATPAEIVSAYRLGGVIYLGENIADAEQVGRFSAGLQEAAEADSGIGLLVAVDQEGGRVNRLTDGVTVFPSAAVLSGDIETVREAGYVTGRQVTLQGINVVLAPVADIGAAGADGAIGSRSYGEDPALVADMVSAAVGGLQEAGVAAAVKHWPGHGGTEDDSHTELPKLEVDKAGWDANERIPFEAALDEDVSIVLVGHLVFPQLDPSDSPATTSQVLIEELLRGELGYDGVVMTDALNMGAVSDFDEPQLVVASLVAGADIMLVPRDLPGSYQAVLDAVASGELSQERLDESVTRVLRLKQQLGLLPTS
ncbi:MAG: glycoside hydrolase family 3 protein [Actinomycetota bacterium]